MARGWCLIQAVFWIGKLMVLLSSLSVLWHSRYSPIWPWKNWVLVSQNLNASETLDNTTSSKDSRGRVIWIEERIQWSGQSLYLAQQWHSVSSLQIPESSTSVGKLSVHHTQSPMLTWQRRSSHCRRIKYYTSSCRVSMNRISIKICYMASTRTYRSCWGGRQAAVVLKTNSRSRHPGSTPWPFYLQPFNLR